MKKTTLMIALLWSITAQAQKVDIEYQKVMFFFTQLPARPIPARTYTTTVKVMDFKNYNTTLMGPEGMKKVESNGDVLIQFHVKESKTKSEKTENTSVSKNDKGVEISTTTYNIIYSTQMVYDYRVLYKDSVLIDTSNVHYEAVSKASPTDFASTKERADWQMSKSDVNKTTAANAINAEINRLDQGLNLLFGYGRRNTFFRMQYLNPNKHPEGLEYKEQITTAATYLASLSQYEAIDSAKLQPCISYLDSLIIKYPANEKEDKKIRLSAYYNLLYINYCLERLDEAKIGLIKF